MHTSFQPVSHFASWQRRVSWTVSQQLSPCVLLPSGPLIRVSSVELLALCPYQLWNKAKWCPIPTNSSGFTWLFGFWVFLVIFLFGFLGFILWLLWLSIRSSCWLCLWAREKIRINVAISVWFTLSCFFAAASCSSFFWFNILSMASSALSSSESLLDLGCDFEAELSLDFGVSLRSLAGVSLLSFFLPLAVKTK